MPSVRSCVGPPAIPALRELRGSGLPPCASGNTHMASTANTAKPITNQNRCGLPLAFSQ